MAASDKRIFLWMQPRSVSTAFAKLVANMDGAMVWLEPYVAAYFKQVFEDPVTFTTFPKMKNMVAQFQEVVAMDSVKQEYEGGNLESSQKYTYNYAQRQLEKPMTDGSKFMFVKDAAWAIEGRYEYLPKVPFRHTFLIRHPNRVALSSLKLMATFYDHKGDIEEFDINPGTNPFMSWGTISPDSMYAVWKYVRENIEPNPVVIDADDLQNHTGDIMQKYCAAVGIPWEDRYLSFSAGGGCLKFMHGSMEHVILGVKSNAHKEAIKSSKINPCATGVPSKVPAGCEGVAKALKEGYNAMYEHRIKPDKM